MSLRLARWALPAVLALIAVGIYGNSLRNGFILDDVYCITQNTFIRDPANLPKLFTKDYYRLAQEGGYRPVATAALFAHHALWGDRAPGYRAGNIALHVLAVLLLFWLLLRLLDEGLGPRRSRPAAFFGALLFAVHPAHSQLINVTSMNEDLLCLVFLLAAFHLHLAGRRAWSLGAFVVALLSKEMAVTFPVVLTLYEWLLAPRRSPRALCRGIGPALAPGYGAPGLAPRREGEPRWTRRRVASLAAFFALSGLYVLGRFTVLKPAGVVMESNGAQLSHLPGLSELLGSGLAACAAGARYLGLLVWPAALSSNWDSILAHAPASPALQAFGAFMLAALLVLAWRSQGAVIGAGCRLRDSSGSGRRSPWISFGVLFFLVTLFPVSGFIPFWSRLEERYLYIPSAGFFLVAGCALEWLWEKARAAGRRRAGLALATVLLLPAALGLRTAARNRDFKDELTLYGKESAEFPGSYGAWYGLGYALGQKGDYRGAKVAFLKAAALDPYHKTHFMLGFVEEKLGGSIATVRMEYEKAIALAPDYYPVHFNLAAFLQKQGNLDEAVAHYQAALRIQPRYREAGANLGAAYMAQGRFDEAATELAKALEMEPELDTPLTAGLEAKIEHNLATALFNLDRNDEALAHLHKAIALNPALEKKPIVKALPIDGVGADVMVENDTGLDELKQDPVVAIHRVSPKSLELPLQGMRSEPGIEGVGSEPLVFDLGESARRRVQAEVGAVKMRGREDLADGSYHEGSADIGEGPSKTGFASGVGLPPFFHEAQDVLGSQLDPALLEPGAKAGRQLTPRDADDEGVGGGGHRRVPDVHHREYIPPAPRFQLAELKKLYPKLSGKWEAAEKREYAETPEGFRPKLGYLGSSPAGALKPEEKAALEAMALRDRAPAPFSVLLPAKASEKLALDFNGVRVEQALRGCGPSAAQAGEGLMAYPDVYPETSMFFIADSRSVEQLFLLRGPSAPSRFAEEVAVSSGSLRREESGELALYGPAGEKKLQLSRPLILDAKGKEVAGDWQLESAGASAYLVTLAFDPKGLAYPLLVDPTWTVAGAGALATARAQYTATLLPDGKVLVAGGQDGGTPLLTAELYDPLTGTWSNTGSLSTARYGHAATLLPNGNGTGNGNDVAWAVGTDPSGNVFAAGQTVLATLGMQIWLGKFGAPAPSRAAGSPSPLGEGGVRETLAAAEAMR